MKIKIMSFNLRCPVQKDGVNYFPNREGRILETIAKEDPDIIGFQEAADYSRDFLKKNLCSKYTVIGCARNSDYHGEAATIAYKTDLFDLVNYEARFLSTTPTVPGNRYEGSDQSKCPRMYAHAELIHKDMIKPIHVFNTHLDHLGEIARILGMTQIMQHVSTVSGEFVLTGDMNAEPTSDCIKVALDLKGRNVKDATAAIERSFHNFGNPPNEYIKIDYIFTDADPIEAYAVKDEPVDGVYISDHYPICAWIEFKEEKQD